MAGPFRHGAVIALEEFLVDGVQELVDRMIRIAKRDRARRRHRSVRRLRMAHEPRPKRKLGP